MSDSPWGCFFCEETLQDGEPQGFSWEFDVSYHTNCADDAGFGNADDPVAAAEAQAYWVQHYRDSLADAGAAAAALAEALPRDPLGG